MKIKSIKKPEKTWFHTEKNLSVKTPNGEQSVNKIWFNGFVKPLELTFKKISGEVYKIKCTEKHKFLSLFHGWVEAKDMIYGYEFQDDWIYEKTEKLKEFYPTFDIEVPEEHCYVLESGIVTHNSTAGILGGVSQGIEPVYKNVYVQGSAAGEMNRINPIFLDLLKKKGIYDENHINEVINHNGSVQNVEWLNEEEKKVFKTAFEIDQKVIIRLASVRQKYIDQAQSINLFFSADESEEYISEVHQMAFNDPMIKSLYYIRSESGVQASKGECESCAG